MVLSAKRRTRPHDRQTCAGASSEHPPSVVAGRLLAVGAALPLLAVGAALLALLALLATLGVPGHVVPAGALVVGELASGELPDGLLRVGVVHGDLPVVLHDRRLARLQPVPGLVRPRAPSRRRRAERVKDGVGAILGNLHGALL